ncbi:lipopolysaccharide assembly protein LapA domain-containing protein [Frateuria soli]|uniref:lipopolysaccharide assembly protein LapA domain-containing protein n=1 Tax=Frateuria soli TaxID=1542730 RepID=UPI001E41F329|nr:lipopolysaccharide assembly protein LapA domain-containing protein [Frateuria soli]UGB39365.1 lipopolysaccharide assembly protein LapA domain-containing protein [Frateuria soli]
MRLIALLILAFFVVVGVVVGALNADPVSYDLAFFQLTMPKGAGLLVALVIGWLLGGLTAWLGMSVRHRRVLRRARSSSGKTPARA